MTALETNPLRAPGDGGVGFCYATDRDLFRGAGTLADGPLLIALDSNIIFDLEQYGVRLIDGVLDDGSINGALFDQLIGLGELLEMWMVRDIRFVVVAQTRADFKRPPPPVRVSRREYVLARIEDALTFQLGDWSDEHARARWSRAVTEDVSAQLARVSSQLDRSMLASAWAAGADVFLTRDRMILSALPPTADQVPLVCSPKDLSVRLAALQGVWPFNGLVEHNHCAWASAPPFGDTGKWVALIEAMS